MKKFYLIVFLGICISAFITAQVKPVAKQTQPASSQIIPAAQKPAAKPATTAKPETKEPAKAINKGKSAAAKKKKRRVSSTTIYGNEWINYNQKYYKIKVPKTGLYRIDSAVLAQAGVPVDTINNKYYQLYFQGKQQYIYIRSNGPNLSEKNGDYIEFYGQYNDGTLDSTLYYNTNFMPSPYYSLFNDTSSYYLTWTSSVNGLRMIHVPDTGWASYSAFPYVMTSTVVGWQAPTNGTTRFSSSVTLEPTTAQFFSGAQWQDGIYTPNDPRFTQNCAWIPEYWALPNAHITFTPNINGNLVYTGGGAPAAFMRTVVLGINFTSCPFTVSTSARQLDTGTCNGFQAFDFANTFPATDLTGGVFTVSYYNNQIVNNNSYITSPYIYLNYPHTTNLGGDTTFTMEVPDGNGPGPKTFLELTNLYTKGPNDSVWMYDLTNHRRFWCKPERGGYWVLDSNSGGLKQCYVTNDDTVIKIKSITPVGIHRTGTFTDFTTGPDSAYIIITHPSLWNSVDSSYAPYRRSKGFNVVVADVYELYDQFGYGVDYSPLGIRRFCNYAIDKWSTNSPPSNLFLMGKGIHTPIFRADTAVWSRNQMLVPSFGNPSSDVLFTNGLGGDTLLEPAIPTGRLAAKNNSDVMTYLSKVQTFESTPAAQWMKNQAQFVGGDTYNEESLFLNDCYGIMQDIRDTFWGGQVFLFQKSTPAPISNSLTDSIINLINNGVGIMNFYGHADGSNWDESVDAPNEFANYGKYPFMMAEACFSGDIFQPEGEAVSNVSEQWVLQPPGAIAFLASDFLSDPQVLETWADVFYSDITLRMYRKPLAACVQNTIEQTQTLNGELMVFSDLEMTLHGDPAIAINATDSLPDYAVNTQSIYFTPANVTVLNSSFTVHVIVSNNAEALNQPVSGILTRTFPDGISVPYPFTFNHVYYQDTFSIEMPVTSGANIGSGFNSFCVDVNPLRTDRELTYANNNIVPCVQMLISSEDITPVWPYDYAIIATDTATLKASTNDPFAPQHTYIFEIDTSHAFNSPLFRSDTVTNSGGVIEISPYADWGKTHFKGAEKREPVKGEKQPVILKGGKRQMNREANTNPAVQTSNTPQNNTSRPAAPPQNKPEGVQQTTAKSTVQSITPIKQMGLDKFNPATVKSWHRGLPHDSFLNNAVYYWRVRRDTIDSLKYPWVNTSFQYIKGKYGWGQSDYYQYNNDDVFNDNYNFINFNNPLRDWTFNTQDYTLECFTYGMLKTNLNTTDLYATEFKIDDYVQAYAGCSLNEGFYVAVIDPLTITPWSTQDYDFGEADKDHGICSDYPDNKFVFMDNDVTQMDSLARMLNLIPNGDYILVWTWINGYYKAPGLSNAVGVDSALYKLGCTQIFSHTVPGKDSVPMIFFVQKGVPGSAHQLFGATSTSALADSFNLKGSGTLGCITTPYIGPSTKYDSLSWHQHSYDRGPLTDSTRLNVIGIQTNGNPQTLLSNVTPSVASMYISSINAAVFPYIQMQMYCKDTTHKTPAQMNWWRVFYQPVPEIAMNPNFYTYYHADTLEYGDKLNFQTTVQNISDWPIATTQLLTWTTDAMNNIKYYNNPTFVKPLNPGDTAKISFMWPDSVASANSQKSVWFEINPENYPKTRLEQYHFNDYAYKSFYSYGDKINPVLDVTFNGIHILNNDIVSPQPNILITFMDENKFLAMNNPADFHVYLQDKTTNGPIQTIPYGSTLSFTPAVLPNNKCSLLYTPTLPDGTYELTVQGNDIAGNPSANNSYKIDFQVINKSMITEVVNYPNPFSTSTRFVFILTGDQIPTTFKIQIMTVSGKIVREINESEIGPIHIGRNITQFAWDGTDKFGSKLANGVYLYRVITSINGQGIDEFEQGYNGANVDQYFTKNWGKMYLMR